MIDSWKVTENVTTQDKAVTVAVFFKRPHGSMRTLTSLVGEAVGDEPSLKNWGHYFMDGMMDYAVTKWCCGNQPWFWRMYLDFQIPSWTIAGTQEFALQSQ
ncbi:MAG: hypothetical protein SGJ03_16980 [Alphaproteobacteria bacterium]|nr:hypothetical protein [Alphaproteobacteria bacterium]